MKKILSIIIAVFVFVLCAHNLHAKRKDTMQIVGGASIPKYGLAIDASYDSRFDNFAKGYKILQVAIINNSFNMIPMNPEKDKWVVHTRKGGSYKAYTDLGRKDPEAWKELPLKVRDIMAYPLILPIGVRRVIDLFVPEKVPLETLQSVVIDLQSLDTRFEVVVID